MCVYACVCVEKMNHVTRSVTALQGSDLREQVDFLL